MRVSLCASSYLSAVPGPPHQDHQFLIVVQDPESLEPPGGGPVDLQQQTVPAAGHGHVNLRRTQDGCGDDRAARKGLRDSPS